MRTFHLPPKLDSQITKMLFALGHDIARPSGIADAIKKLSEFYLQNPKGESPYHEKWTQTAYLAYYFPLNYARAKAVVNEVKRSGFLEGLTSYVDFGSGLGSAAIALDEIFEFQERSCIDRSSSALHLQKELRQGIDLSSAQITWTEETPQRLRSANNTVGLFSYSLTEVGEIPLALRNLEAYIIIEPSTREDGRHLQTIRSQLIEQGYSIWAPCTHQESCPLLTKSERDWCHDRIAWQGPSWWNAIEKLLPMKNQTLTFSYLLARRTPPPKSVFNTRVVGDMLPEKGKSRVLICRNEQREFLSWFPQRMKTEPVIYRGERLRFLNEPELRANEVRIRTAEDLEKEPT